MGRLWLVVLVGLLMLAAPRPAVSTDPTCAADVKQFCAGIERGGGRIAKCLRDHEAQLSAPCKAKIATAMAKRTPGVCAADKEKFCKGVKHGGGRVAKCLQEHEAELSAACKAERTAKHPTAAAGGH